MILSYSIDSEQKDDKTINNVRSPLATANFFSQFDKVINQKFSNADNDKIDEASLTNENQSKSK
jgi:hypothetical protein